MSKRVSNKAHGGGARTRPRLGYWRLRKAQLRADRAKDEREQQRKLAAQVPPTGPQSKGALHSLMSSFKKLVKQGRQRHTGGQHG